MSERRSVGPDGLDECWCCGGLHDSVGTLCPDCDDAGCQHFGGECQSDHKPVMPDGGRPGVEVKREGPEYDLRAQVDYINRQAADLYTKWQHYQLGERDVEDMLITTTGLKEDLNELESIVKELQDHPQEDSQP